jgi:hypothetical protein
MTAVDPEPKSGFPRNGRSGVTERTALPVDLRRSHPRSPSVGRCLNGFPRGQIVRENSHNLTAAKSIN